MKTLTNKVLTIGVKEHGAELASLRHDGREYIWQADPAYWKRHSPVLFPIVGSVWNGEFRVDGQVYAMGQHGFARDLDFTLANSTDNRLTYRLVSDAGTLASYPFDFVLDITYELVNNMVRVIWTVRNTGTRDMPFQIGAHPAFYWPMLTDSAIEGGIETMERELAENPRRGYLQFSARSLTLPISVVTEKGCIGDTSTLTLNDGGYLPIDSTTFSRDALVFEDWLVNGVTICDDDRRPYLTVEFDSPLLGVWSPPGRNAPFVCIEPWYGRADSVGYQSEFRDRKWVQILASGCEFTVSYNIIVHV